MMRFRLPLGFALTLALVTPTWAQAQDVAAAHGVAMHGDLKYGPEFEHFDYVNPDAPKGGAVTFASIGTFDTLNPFIIKGTKADGLGFLFETLTTQSEDEPFSEYGLLAESIEMPEDRSWVAFTLRPEARWHDGKPVTVEDVIFSFNTLKEKGLPFYRAYYKNVIRVEPAGERRVKFTFEETTNRELPLILGQLPILPKHYYEEVEFDKTALQPPLGSGPYRIKSLEPGRRIVYERVRDYWGAELPVSRGFWNFDEIRYEYYRDANVALEAFKAGGYDIRVENTSKFWATAYTGPMFDAGWIQKEEIPHELGTGMQGFAYNLRRPMFQDHRVRRALAYAFDFEWTNRTIMYGQYDRTESYFSNTELAAEGLPDAAELELLEPFRDQLPEEVFTEVYQAPSTEDEGGIRQNLRTALRLLGEAGWSVEGGRLVNAQGQPFRFEILLNGPSFERHTLPFIRNLERLGIQATVRAVDPAQYQNRMDEFDFDVVVASFGQSLSPGNEQREYWGSEAADIPGSRNVIGIKDPVVDHLIDKIIEAPTREDLVTATRALDRVLLWGHYVIPHWHSRIFRVAYWNKFDRPQTNPPYGLPLFSWWVDPVKVAAVEQRKAAEGGAQAETIE
ncbi:MAG TPA: extracellular solute-binding protein [Geminicoccaceae bacterium]